MVLSPFPANRFCNILSDVEKIISVECNSTGQLARLTALYGYPPDVQILRYNGRPFSLNDLEADLRRVLA
jgi:2-oxoglutarate ferredoxin oxidoreductase subunit alpha